MSEPEATGVKAAFNALFPNFAKNRMERLKQMSTPGWQFFKRVVIFMLIIVTFGITYQVMMSNYPDEWEHPKDDNGNSIINGMYFSTIIASTTGYGDYYPYSKRAMLIVVLNVLVAWILFQTMLNVSSA